MQITLNTAEPLSDLDRAVLATLLGAPAPAAPANTVAAPAAVAETAAPTLTAVPDVVEPEKPKRTRRTKAQIAADEAAAAAATTVPELPTPEQMVDEALSTDGPAVGPTLADAIAAATELLSNNGGPKVKAALESLGAAKVSQLAPADIPAFLDALGA